METLSEGVKYLDQYIIWEHVYQRRCLAYVTHVNKIVAVRVLEVTPHASTSLVSCCEVGQEESHNKESLIIEWQVFS